MYKRCTYPFSSDGELMNLETVSCWCKSLPTDDYCLKSIIHTCFKKFPTSYRNVFLMMFSTRCKNSKGFFRYHRIVTHLSDTNLNVSTTHKLRNTFINLFGQYSSNLLLSISVPSYTFIVDKKTNKQKFYLTVCT